MNFKSKVGIGIGVVIIAGTVVSQAAFGGGNAEPGTLEDPIVTKSYVDQQVINVEQTLKTYTDDSIKQIPQSQTNSGDNTPISSATLEVLQLNRGDILLAKPGTEMILRAGKAIAHGNGTDGIPDVTGGADLKIGAEVPRNHQLIFPRDDGRGIKITAGPAYVMVRGEVALQEAE